MERELYQMSKMEQNESNELTPEESGTDTQSVEEETQESQTKAEVSSADWEDVEPEEDDEDIEELEFFYDPTEEKEEKKKAARARRRQKRQQKKAAKAEKMEEKAEKPPMGKKPWIIAGSIVGALVLIYLGISAYFIGHFYINTEINGRDFSGQSAAAVEEYIKEQVEGYGLTIIEQNNEQDTISGSEISLTYKENSDIDDALSAQNPLLWPMGFFSKNSAKVTIDVDYDEATLQEKIQTIKAVTQEQTQPSSAYPKFDGTSFVVEPEVYGTAVDTDVLTEKIKQYITEFKSELNMLDEECYVMPKYTSESAEVQAACDTMNKYCQASVTYTMDTDVIADKALISTWLTYDDNMQVTLNRDSVREWMRQFGETYDTVGSTRSITTPTGKTTEVSGGTYGWSVDEEAETDALITSIQNGEVISKEPVYEQTAASRGAQDWGTTYVEVDLTTQHMWYIVDGSVVMEADVVTGLPTPERETPAGVYSILEMKRNKTLVGETDPATGKPIYETPVDYWMRVTWSGVGFHDANWQASFGGSRYQTHGSHGCINMRPDQAAALYSLLSVGTPVVMHY